MYYFVAPRPFQPRRIDFSGSVAEQFRTVVQKYTAGRTSYIRHTVFGGYFKKAGGDWYLESTPSYIFTMDCFKTSKFAKITKDDREIHMTGDGAHKLISDSLAAYREEHKTMPARVVVHKTSSYDDDELDGFIEGIEERNIELYDLVNISRSYSRLFRVGLYPPIRGTAIEVDEDRAILYSRDSVDFFQTYPGMYVPRPIDIVAEDSDRSISAITAEILALTKMNWNNTEFDNSMPITVQAARKVGRILKYLGSQDKASPLYSFYM